MDLSVFSSTEMDAMGSDPEIKGKLAENSSGND